MLCLFNMKEFKDLIKKHKKIELAIKHFTKLRMNDRAFSSWEKLRKLKKEKLKLKQSEFKKKINFKKGFKKVLLSK